MIDKGLLHGVQGFPGFQPLDGHDLAAIAVHRIHQATVDSFSIEPDRAGAAFAFAASVFCAGQIEHVTQHGQGLHGHRHGYCYRAAIQFETNFSFQRHHSTLLPSILGQDDRDTRRWREYHQ